jgi:NAD(P)-dependent dehydrogenase (short-subunit alcohol dehydrogenase family)
MKLEGKVAIITGASRGLGKAFALDFAREGADVVVAARTETEGNIPGTINQTADEIKAIERRALAVRCDVTKEESVEEVVKKTLDEFGRIDILVNNAGVAWWPPITETPLKRFELVLRVNLIGAFLCVKAVLPTMIEEKRGSIINISSLAANKRVRGFSGISYGVSKAGLERFTWGLAAELGQYNIAVNAIKPLNVIGTEGIVAQAPPDADKSQWQTSDLMVKACTFLAAQDAGGVTGTIASDDEFCQWHGLV